MAARTLVLGIPVEILVCLLCLHITVDVEALFWLPDAGNHEIVFEGESLLLVCEAPSSLSTPSFRLLDHRNETVNALQIPSTDNALQVNFIVMIQAISENRFSCEVSENGNIITTEVINLKVANEDPACYIDSGLVVTDGDVVPLSCYQKERFPTPDATWRKIRRDGMSQVLLPLVHSGTINSFKRKTSTSVNITSDDDGVSFQCEVKTMTESLTCETGMIAVQKQSPATHGTAEITTTSDQIPSDDTLSTTIFFIIGGAVAIVLTAVIIIIIGMLVYTARRRKQSLGGSIHDDISGDHPIRNTTINHAYGEEDNSRVAKNEGDVAQPVATAAGQPTETVSGGDVDDHTHKEGVIGYANKEKSAAVQPGASAVRPSPETVIEDDVDHQAAQIESLDHAQEEEAYSSVTREKSDAVHQGASTVRPPPETATGDDVDHQAVQDGPLNHAHKEEEYSSVNKEEDTAEESGIGHEDQYDEITKTSRRITIHEEDIYNDSLDWETVI